uniref:(northern house mosquito) hypothetical protein n=1 Tax=Culex pipiens TaxID=7175 RepID=A0A8D8B0I7_CULPI
MEVLHFNSIFPLNLVLFFFTGILAGDKELNLAQSVQYHSKIYNDLDFWPLATMKTVHSSWVASTCGSRRVDKTIRESGCHLFSSTSSSRLPSKCCQSFVLLDSYIN